MGLQDDPAQPDHQDDLGDGEEFYLRTLEQERGRSAQKNSSELACTAGRLAVFFLTTVEFLPERTVAGLRVPYLLIYNPE